MLNIARSKSNQPMKFGQLLECNMRNIFPEQSCTNCDGKTCHRLFSEELKLSISLDISSLKFHTICFYCLASCGLSKFIKTKLQTTCFHLISGFFKLTKRGLELVFQTQFLHNFWRKIFLLYSINWPIFTVWLPLFCEILGNMCIKIVCKPGCDIIIFEISFVFLIKQFFPHDQKVVTKT